MPYMVGIDTGGTFTDAVVIDEKGIITTGKALTTPPAFVEGIMNALEDVAGKFGMIVEELLQQTEMFSLSTTIATNTMITRSGVKTGLIITAGAEDTLHIARAISRWTGLSEEEIKHVYRLQKVEPLIPKDLIKGVNERTDWKGAIVCPLDVEEVKQAAKSLVNRGAESIATCFLWSFRNPAHENEAKKIISELYPEVFLSISSEVAPILGEYERCNTTVINAYVGPITAKFLSSLNKTLTDKGLKCPMLVMQAHGGTVYGAEAIPLATFQSGPAAGVIGSKFIGEILGHKNIITTDVGGTSFDVSLIAEGSWIYAREPVIERFAVSFPIIDIASIGAGGGSIVWVDAVTGMLRIGPKSAGASPGPACYGLGGIEPTVTDADLILGYLNPGYFLGGKMKLYPEKAFAAMKKAADQIGMHVTQTAAGVYDIINSRMADLVRVITVGRGYDPREFVLFAYGGAGPMHAATYGTELGVKQILIPFTASTYSALGLATSDILHTHILYDFGPIPMDIERFNGNFETLERKVLEDLDRDGIKQESRAVMYFLEMRYELQYHVIKVPIPKKKYKVEDMDFITQEFDRCYEALYGKEAGCIPAERFVTSFIVQGLGKILKPALSKYEMKGPDTFGALKGRREVFFRKYNDYVDTDIYEYEKLQTGNVIKGPAIVEAPQTTVVIPPEQKGQVDEYLNILISS